MTYAQRTLNIFYRHVHVKTDQISRDPNKARPVWFSHEACFRNLLKTIARDRNAARVTITIIYDSSLEDFQDDFIAKYYANTSLGLNIQFIAGGSDRNSFLITLAIAKSKAHAPHDLIYFLENDYLHQDGWIDRVLEAFNSDLQFDYLSLYDHNDKYTYPMYDDLKSKIICTRNQHWRTAPSTCASFIVEHQTLLVDYDILSSGLTDYYFFTRLCLERQRVLITPIPGLSTHSMLGYISPVVDWATLAKDAISE